MKTNCNILAILLLIAATFAGVYDASAQMPIRTYVTKRIAPDSLDVVRQTTPHFWRAAAEVGGFNLGLWGFDRFVQHGDYSYISFNTIKENFRHGFIWDNDKLNTNMFAHPYNGNLYYNAARSNGYNFWQSGLFAVAGSAMWELFMEREYPSTNDVIATPIGGMAIGEVTYRASDLIIDDRETGGARIGREIGVWVVSPMRGLTRLITGDAWKVRPTTGRQFGMPNLAIELMLGTRMLDFHHDGAKVKFGGTFETNIEYGDRFLLKSHRPYSYFNVNAQLNIMDGQPLLSHLSIKGRLLSREFLEDRDTHLSVGLFQHFDFYDSDTIAGGAVPFKLGVPASVGVGVFFRDIQTRRWVLDAYAHLNGVMLGSVLSDYYQLDDRNYNLANGFSVKAGANIVLGQDKMSLSGSFEYYRLFTWKGYENGRLRTPVNFRTLNVMGDKSVASFMVTTFRADVKLWSRTYATLFFDHYYRSTHYRDYPHVGSSSIGARLMLTYKL